jgi:hypothetical protein
MDMYIEIVNIIDNLIFHIVHQIERDDNIVFILSVVLSLAVLESLELLVHLISPCRTFHYL